MSAHAIPFHCPYCGGEDLRPHETDQGSGHGAWECRACLRAFSLKMLGLIPPRAVPDPMLDPADAVPDAVPDVVEVNR